MSAEINRLTKLVVDNTVTNFKESLLNYFTGTDGFPSENILHRYRTFNYNVTLAVVSPQEFNSGSYKKTGFDHVLFASYGRNDLGVTAKSASNFLNNFQTVIQGLYNEVNPAFDLYLQDLSITSTFTAKRDIGTEFKLKILEPYSTDAFITRIMEGLQKKGYQAFNRSNAFVMRIDFVGWRDDKEVPEVIPFSTRYYPLIITNMKVNITQEGTTYDITGVPLNDTGRHNDLNVISEPFTLKAKAGSTIDDVLKDLFEQINAYEQKTAKGKQYLPNEYAYKFLPDTTDISQSKMFDPLNDAGGKATAYAPDSYIAPKKNNANATAPAEKGTVQFTVNTGIGISNVVDNIIADSKFIVEKINNNFEGLIGTNGQVKWWRIIPEVELLKHDPAKNIQARKTTYLISPWYINQDRLKGLFSPGTNMSIPKITQVARTYEWLYTGNNRDIINFKIQYDQMFARIITANLGTAPQQPGQGDSSMTEEKKEYKFSPVKEIGNVLNWASNKLSSATVTESKNNSGSSTNTSRAGESNPAHPMVHSMAKIFHSPYENLMFDMDILGDPMWLGTQFIDSTSTTRGSNLFTVDGGIAMRSVDPIVKVLAYAPKDFNRDGLLTTEGSAQGLSSWSAFYNVTGVQSSFKGGQFTQKITGYRQGIADMQAAATTTNPVAGVGVVNGSALNTTTGSQPNSGINLTGPSSGTQLA